MNKKLLTILLATVIVAVTLTAGIIIGKNLSKEDITDIISTTSAEAASVVTTTTTETTATSATVATTAATTVPTTVAPTTKAPVADAETVKATTEKITEDHTAPENKPPENRISPEKAKKIALKNAGFGADDVFDLDIELDFERGAWIYEISFENSNNDYEYIIDAVSGNILHSQTERDY